MGVSIAAVSFTIRIMMTNVMKTRLGRKGWFAGLLGFLSALLTLPLLQAAGLRSPDN